ncbi:MAG: hypothetical protein IJ867_07700 [Clostridia bacterium]|nr:hypothetical protein [Clostridia bacterium]
MKKEKLRRLIAIVLIVIFTFSVVPKTFQNDTFYVIELGRRISENGIDWQDHYSIHPNLEYKYPHWVFDIINYFIYNAFGFGGIYVGTCVLASIFMLLVFWNMRRKEINFNLAFFSTLIVAYLMKGTFYARGQIVSYSIFLLEYMILENFVERPTFFKSLALFALSVIMANIHGTAWMMMLVLVLPFIGEQVVYWYSLKGINERQLRKLKKKLKKAKEENASQEEIAKIEAKLADFEEFKMKYAEAESQKEHKILIKEKKNIKYIWVACLVLILGALLTPFGLTPIIYVLKTSVGNSMSYINEHLPIIPANSMEFLTYSIVMVALLGFTKSKLKLYDAFLILGLYLMTLSGRRYEFLLIGLTAGIVTKMIDDFMKENIQTENEKVSKTFFIIICIVGAVASIYFFVDKRKDSYISEKTYPVQATRFIKENLDYQNIRMYNGYNYGSYLLMEGIPVFIDSRCDLYTPEFNKGVTVFDDYMKGQAGKITIAGLMDQYELEYALVAAGSYEDNYMEEDLRFTQIYQDENFAIYEYMGNGERVAK